MAQDGGRVAPVETSRPGGSARRMLDVRMPLGRKFRLRIVERPGLSLAPSELERVCADLRAVASRTLPAGELTYGVLGGDPERLANAVVTVIYDRASGEPVAFNALSLLDATLAGRPVEVLHLGLVMVDPAVRGAGLSEMLYGLTCVLLFVRRQCRPVWLSNVTQVPAVVGMVSETFADVFPTPARRAEGDFAHRILARQIMARWRHAFGVGADATFDERRFVIQNAYTGGSDDLKKTFEAAPKHRIETYNAMCREALDYDRGDDLLQIGQINMEAARRYLSKVVEPQSAPWLAGRLALFAVQSAVLPVIQWFADDQPWGMLRPRRSPT